MRRYSDADAAAEAERDYNAANRKPMPTEAPKPVYGVGDVLAALEFATRTIDTLMPVKSTPGQRKMASEAKIKTETAINWLRARPSTGPASNATPPIDLVAHLFDIETGDNGHIVATTRGLGPLVIAASSRAELEAQLPHLLKRFVLMPPSRSDGAGAAT